MTQDRKHLATFSLIRGPAFNYLHAPITQTTLELTTVRIGCRDEIMHAENREVMSDVFLSTTAAVSTKSALFVAWGQLLTYDMSLTVENGSEPFNIACDEGGGAVDVWCPVGADSDEIIFDRSDAAAGSDSVRSPVNYATSYIDLDFMYGRSEEEAKGFRKLEGGLMNVTASGVPFQNVDGTWMVSRVAGYRAGRRYTLPERRVWH